MTTTEEMRLTRGPSRPDHRGLKNHKRLSI